MIIQERNTLNASLIDGVVSDAQGGTGGGGNFSALQSSFEEQLKKINNRSWNFKKFTQAEVQSITMNSETSASLTITTTGRPVLLLVSGDNNPTTDDSWIVVRFYRDGTLISYQYDHSRSFSQNIPFSMAYLDAIPAGTYNYTVGFQMGGGDSTLAESGELHSPNFIVYEI